MEEISPFAGTIPASRTSYLTTQASPLTVRRAEALAGQREDLPVSPAATAPVLCLGSPDRGIIGSALDRRTSSAHHQVGGRARRCYPCSGRPSEAGVRLPRRACHRGERRPTTDRNARVPSRARGRGRLRRSVRPSGTPGRGGTDRCGECHPRRSLPRSAPCERPHRRADAACLPSHYVILGNGSGPNVRCGPASSGRFCGAAGCAAPRRGHVRVRRDRHRVRPGPRRVRHARAHHVDQSASAYESLGGIQGQR